MEAEGKSRRGPARGSASDRVFSALLLDARVLELERALAEKSDSASWRVAAPLRRFNRRLRERAERRCEN